MYSIRAYVRYDTHYLQQSRARLARSTNTSNESTRKRTAHACLFPIKLAWRLITRSNKHTACKDVCVCVCVG